MCDYPFHYRPVVIWSMAKIEVQDAERVEDIKTRAKEIISVWLDECTDEALEKEPDVHISDSVTMAAYMTAAYSVYHNLVKYVQEGGGVVYPLPFDGSSDPEDRS